MSVLMLLAQVLEIVPPIKATPRQRPLLSRQPQDGHRDGLVGHPPNLNLNLRLEKNGDSYYYRCHSHYWWSYLGSVKQARGRCDGCG
ncbi:hypothetical protein BKA82DRAFT_994533 [Pisolithus tinctorius]|uniref:Uncharacterized protein n=1 Tax=Pisolithus tinctorius Marx 270 TaxID=870435 RepID=A0A0C3JRU9_PISTI|nr:hypothetical protein BKA82DRAFT_994533 [Pisolithus tinctorius]KIO11858.1 hypothetical protein M404DRAFT_994533 [Pisolithus tinctorius Marx 270]